MGEDRSITSGVGFEADGKFRRKGSGGESKLGDWAGASFACSDMVLARRSDRFGHQYEWS